MIINKGNPPAQWREWSKLGLASKCPLNVNCVGKLQRKGRMEEDSNAYFSLATNSGDTPWALKELKNIPSDPVAKVLWGMAGVGAWLTDIRCFFSFHQSIFFCSKPLRKLKYSELKNYNPPQVFWEQNFSHFIQKCSNRVCRNIQKCCECSYRHSSSLGWGSHQNNPSKTTNSKHHNSECSLSETISTGASHILICSAVIRTNVCCGGREVPFLLKAFST